MIYLEKNGLTVPIFISLREKAGFVYYRSEDIAEALKKTCYSVVAKDDENAVGMARVVGDNSQDWYATYSRQRCTDGDPR